MFLPGHILTDSDLPRRRIPRIHLLSVGSQAHMSSQVLEADNGNSIISRPFNNGFECIPDFYIPVNSFTQPG